MIDAFAKVMFIEPVVRSSVDNLGYLKVIQNVRNSYTLEITHRNQHPAKCHQNAKDHLPTNRCHRNNLVYLAEC